MPDALDLLAAKLADLLEPAVLAKIETWGDDDFGRLAELLNLVINVSDAPPTPSE